MQIVYKYELKDTPVGRAFTIALPSDARPLSVHVQHGWPCMWVLHTDQVPKLIEDRTFLIYGTGHPIPYRQDELKFIGTVFMDAGNSVYHVFELVIGHEVQGL